MSYFKVLGFGTRRQAAGSTSALFSTAVISGSSSAPNLRDMIPNTASAAALEGFGGVPPIRPLETLHNALSQRQLDLFLETATVAPPPSTPSLPPPTQPRPPLAPPAPATRVPPMPSAPLPKHVPLKSGASSSGPPSAVSSVGVSSVSSGGVSSGGVSSGGVSSCVSSSGPSSLPSSPSPCPSPSPSPAPTPAPTLSSEEKISTNKILSSSGTTSVVSNADNDHSHGIQHDHSSSFNYPGLMHQSVTSGDITPISTGSEWEFNTTDATAGSTADQDLTCTEEEDEATISSEAQSSGVDMTITSSPNNISDKSQLLVDNFHQSTLKGNIIKNDFISGNSSSCNAALAQSVSPDNFDFSKYEKESQDCTAARNTLDKKTQVIKKVNNASSDTKQNIAKNYFTFETGYLFKDTEPTMALPEYKTQQSENLEGQSSSLQHDITLQRALSTGSSFLKETFSELSKMNKIPKNSIANSAAVDQASLARRCSEGVNAGSSQLTLSLQASQRSSDAKGMSSSLKALNQPRQDPPNLKDSPRKSSSTSSRFTTTVVNEAPRTGSKDDESQSKPIVTVANVTNLKTGFKLEENK